MSVSVRLVPSSPALATGLVYATVCLVPLPYGSHDAGSVAVWCAALALAVLTMPVGNMRAVHGLILAAVLAALAPVALVVALQLNPLPQSTPAAGPASLHVGPFFALGPGLANMLALASGVCLGADPRRARRLLHVVAWSGAAYAVYGIVAAAADPTWLLWRERSDYAGSVLGTFVNRNTAATYFGSCSVIWLMLICVDPLEPSLANAPTGSFVQLVAQVAARARRPRQVPRILAASACLAALFMTNSRAGVLCSLGGLCGVALVWFRRIVFFADPVSRRLAALSALGIAAFLLVGGSLNGRFDFDAFSDEGRIAVYGSTLRLIGDHPWIGVGLGGFKAVFPTYRSVPPTIWGVWDMAHSTPLELAAELGIPAAATLCFAGLAGFALLLRGAFRRHRDGDIPAAAAGVTLVAFLHSCVDFSLQIPGYAIVFMTIYGAGLAQSFSSRRGARASAGSELPGVLRPDRQAGYREIDTPVC